ncbi:lactonase family protein, partial [Salmonella enterica subsp. enterica]
MNSCSTDSGLKDLSAGIALAMVALFNPLAHAAQPGNQSFAYVGTYNPNGEGVYRFLVDTKSGELSEKTLVSSLANPAQL